MPARPRGRTEMASMVVSAGATGEGVTLTYLCGRCTRRTHYRVGQAPPPRRGLLSFLGGKTTPAPAPEHYISTTDAELIQQTIYPNRRALAELPKNIAVDETHFCPHCRQSPPPPQLLVNYRCPTCSRTTVYHVDSSPQPEPAKVTPRVAPIMHSRMSAKELRNSFVELAKLKAGLGELGSDFELETTMFCWACGGGKTPRPALKWELTQGQPKILRVGHADLALLKKFVSSLHLPLEQQPKWMHSEAEKIEAMFK